MIGTSVEVDPTTGNVGQAIKDRVARALSLPPATLHGDLWVVQGSVQPNGQSRNYSVSLDHQTYGECCPCRDHELQRERQSGIPCKHIIRATIDSAALNCRRGPKILRH